MATAWATSGELFRALDYLHWLGVDAIWISPIYESPMADFGYDISDYCSVHPIFGSLMTSANYWTRCIAGK